MIGIIGAMEEEVKALLDKTEDIHENKILDCVFYEGKIDNKQVVILQGGIGKVNSAICVTLLLTNYDIEYVINIGSAGGLKDYQNVGDVVISSHVSYHDVDLTAFGRPMGELPELPVFIPADENLVNKAKDILHKMNIHENVGLIVSGDQFIAQEGQVSKIKKDFPNALCSEMEASAVGHTCYKFGVPFIITRSLSDVYGHGESSMQFDEYLKIASENSAKLCVEFSKRPKEGFSWKKREDIELLAPAGSFEALVAAVQNGANAIYLGGQKFGARAFAHNFDYAALKEAVDYCHLRNVKLYVTVNTLYNNAEIDEIFDYLKYLYHIGVDALIIQDMGLFFSY